MQEMPRKPAKPLPSAKLSRLANQLALTLPIQARKFQELRKRVPVPEWSFEVTVVGSAKMKALNAQYRGKAYATDVLSFEAPGVFRRIGYLGELVICSTVLARQAHSLGLSLGEELEVLMVHGLLHLLGFDHEKGAKQAAEMARWERKILGKRAPGKNLIERVR